MRGATTGCSRTGYSARAATVLFRPQCLSPIFLISWLQLLALGEAETTHPILQKNKQEPRSIASLDPLGSRPPGSVPRDVSWGDGTSSAPGQGLGPFSTPAPARLLHRLRPSKGLIVPGKCLSGSSNEHMKGSFVPVCRRSGGWGFRGRRAAWK